MDLFSNNNTKYRWREDVLKDQRNYFRNLVLGGDASDRNEQQKWEVFYLEQILEVWDSKRVLPGK